MKRMKTCPKCKRTMSILKFSRKKSTPDGRQRYCKKCKRKQDRYHLKMWRLKMRREMVSKEKKIAVRKATRQMFKDRSFGCAVPGCSNAKIHLHHINYDDPSCVIPLCEPHHIICHDTAENLFLVSKDFDELLNTLANGPE